MTLSPGWFAAPTFAGVEDTRQARAVWLAGWGFLAVIVCTLGVLVVLQPETLLRRTVTVSAVAALVVALHVVNRRGHSRVAAWVFVTGLVAIVTQRAWITGGMHSPVAVFYVVFVLLAGSLIGGAASVITAALCLVGGAVLTASELAGWLAVRQSSASPLALLVLMLLAVGLTLVVQQLVTERLRASLRRAEAEIVERRRVESDLRFARDGLEEIVASRTGELQRSLNRSRELERLRDDLTSMIVHDMRTPLTLLLSHLTLLQARATPELALDLAQAIRSTHDLNRFACAMLDIARLEAGRMPVRFAPANLSAIAAGVRDEMTALRPDRGILLSSSGDVVCDCDAELMRRVLENLVSNALRHGEGDVRVHARRAEGAVHLSVTDDGPGIPRDMRQRIFEKFGALALANDGAHRSVGIGLAFCKLAVQSHSGTIRVDDATPRGSVFTVILPATHSADRS